MQIPPIEASNIGKKIFTEREVNMRGLDYYMRLFSDGSSEFVRFDATSDKWVYLCFPTENKAVVA